MLLQYRKIAATIEKSREHRGSQKSQRLAWGGKVSQTFPGEGRPKSSPEGQEGIHQARRKRVCTGGRDGEWY